MSGYEKLSVGLAQISPVWLNKAKTLDKAVKNLKKAKDSGCELICFGEGFLPGYPYWISFLADSAHYGNVRQQEIYAKYVEESVDVKAGEIYLKLNFIKVTFPLNTYKII